MLENFPQEFDVIGISETKIKKDVVPKFDIDLQGYKTYSTPTLANKGGAILYISEKHKSKPRSDLNNIMYKSRVLESIFTEIVVPNRKNIVLGCIYRHPSMDLHDFNENYLTPLMNKLNKDKHIFLMGDFNVDLVKTEVDKETATFFDNISSNLFVPHIILPTRITPHSKTLIDNIFSNVANFLQGKSGNITLSISDHLAQFLSIPLDTNFKAPENIKYKRNMKDFDRENFFLDLLSVDWDEILQIETNDPNHSFKRYYHIINTLIDKYMPLKKMTKKEIKQQSKPWINQEILENIQKRDKLKKDYIETFDENTRAQIHLQFKELRCKIQTDIKTSKKTYFQNFFSQNAKNIRETWQGIKSIVNVNSKKKSNPTSLMLNNKLLTDQTLVSDTFNEYFSSIASKLQKKIHQPNKAFSDFLDERNPNTFFIKPTNTLEVINNINDLNTNKGTGPYSIPTNIFHLIKFAVADPLVEIINLSFRTGIYIDSLKISKVMPIFKEKGCELECSNYRPISLLSNINKIIEKLMHERIYTFLEKFKCIYELQFGFRKGHSTSHALIDLTEAIRKAIDENKYSVGVFIDLQKAFDTVDHKILLKKLDYYGIRGTANNWFKSYLTNRQQFVSINSHDSSLRPMNYGVPQGSVLGPLLFLIYINDLHKAMHYSVARHFADDTNLLLSNHNPKQLKKQLNIDLKILTTWLKANKISLNSSKTEILIFKNPNKPLSYDLKLTLDGTRLYPSKYVKYLGILIDPCLTWSYHVKSLAPKLARAAGMLAKLRHYVDQEGLKNIYHGIFASLMNYGSQVWGQYLNQHVQRIVKLQDKAIRIMTFANPSEHSSDLYKKLEIIKFQDNIKISNYLYVHNSINRKLPQALTNKFQYIYEDSPQLTRQSAKQCVKLPIARTSYGLLSIDSQSARTWNSCQILHHQENLHLLSPYSCKGKLKSYILSKY